MEKREGNVFRSLQLFLSAANVMYRGDIFQISVTLTHCKINTGFIPTILPLPPHDETHILGNTYLCFIQTDIWFYNTGFESHQADQKQDP